MIGRRGAAWSAVLVAAIADVVIVATAPSSPLSAELAIAKGTGWVGLVALAATLGATLVGAVFEVRVAPWRRAFGIAAAVGGGIHAALTISTPLVPSIELLIYEPMFRAGATTLVILAALATTSFSAPTRALRIRRWRDLHFLAYVAAVTATHHVALSSHASVGWLVAIAAYFGLALVARLIVRRRTRPPPRSARTS